MPSCTSRKWFRLLELLPGTRQDDIECNLQGYFLDEAPSYEALSYCWGDGSDRTPIQINDCTLYITKNLRTGLLHLRDLHEKRVIWADAICINQQDLVERAKQVSIMGDIYKSAVRTVVWLGATDEKYKNAVSVCSELAATVTDGQRSSKQKGTSNGKASKVDNAKPSDGGDLNNDTSIESLVQLPWWSRVWVVQEVILARDVLLLLGRQSLDWNTFRAAVETGFAQGHWQQHALGNIRVRDFDYFLSLKAIQ